MYYIYNLYFSLGYHSIRTHKLNLNPRKMIAICRDLKIFYSAQNNAFDQFCVQKGIRNVHPCSQAVNVVGERLLLMETFCGFLQFLSAIVTLKVWENIFYLNRFSFCCLFFSSTSENALIWSFEIWVARLIGAFFVPYIWFVSPFFTDELFRKRPNCETVKIFLCLTFIVEWFKWIKI